MADLIVGALMCATAVVATAVGVVVTLLKGR